MSGQWVSLTQGSATDSQALLEKIIGLNRATFLASAYLAQRESDSFTAAQPRDRKRLLSDALALDEWPQAAERVGADRRAAEKELAEVGARLDVYEAQALRRLELEQETERLAGLMTASGLVAEQAESELAAVADALSAAEQAEAAWQTRAQALEVAAAKLAPLKQTAGEAHLARDRGAGVQGDILRLEALAAELEAKQAERARLAEQDRVREEALAQRVRLTDESERLGREREFTLNAWAETSRKLDALEGDAATCDRCGQHVADEALLAARSSLVAEKTEAEVRTAELNESVDIVNAALADLASPEPVLGLDTLDARLAEIRNAPADLAAARERLAGIQALVERATEPAFTQALAQAERDNLTAAQQAAAAVRPEGVDNLRAAAVSAKAAAAMAGQQHTNTRLEHARVAAQLEGAAVADEEHEAALARREALRADLGILAGLEQAFGRDGLPAWIVESQALPQIEAEANRVLARLGGAVSRVEFRTERETKTGERREALDIVCHTDDGERPLETFSGGEQSRAEIACALGLVSLLGSRRGADLRYLALDEPMGLDRQGTEALAEVLREIAAGAGVDCVLLASHDPGLRDSFDQAVTVSKTNGRSVVAA